MENAKTKILTSGHCPEWSPSSLYRPRRAQKLDAVGIELIMGQHDDQDTLRTDVPTPRPFTVAEQDAKRTESTLLVRLKHRQRVLSLITIIPLDQAPYR